MQLEPQYQKDDELRVLNVDDQSEYTPASHADRTARIGQTGKVVDMNNANGQTYEILFKDGLTNWFSPNEVEPVAVIESQLEKRIDGPHE